MAADGRSGSIRKQNRHQKKDDDPRSSIWTTVAYAGAAAFAWAAIEMAFKPWLSAGRRSIQKSLDPDYDVDDELDPSPPPPSSSPPSSDLPSSNIADPLGKSPAKIP